MNFQPIVKWSGSKRTQSEQIVSRMPKEISIYYEPFCGGCSVLRQLLQTPEIKVGKYVASDVNSDLISLWNEIKDNPQLLCDEYKRMWHELNDGHAIEEKKKYFIRIREEFNEDKDPAKFLFIMRTTTNGMPRYNSSGKFNNTFHVTRDGILPDSLTKICLEWSDLLNKNDVEFIHRSYENVSGDDNSLTYLDPPYFNTQGMYYGPIDYKKYFEWLGNLKGKWIMSFDGKVNGELFGKDCRLPENLYKTKEFLTSGKSSFRRIIGKGDNFTVEEALYMNF